MRQLSRDEIKAIRRKTGLTQVAFADTYGIPLGTLHNWEQGERQPETTGVILLHIIRSDPEATALLVKRAKEAEGCPEQT